MDRKEAIEIIKNCSYIGSEVGVAFDVAIDSMKKLDKISKLCEDNTLRGLGLVPSDRILTIIDKK